MRDGAIVNDQDISAAELNLSGEGIDGFDEPQTLAVDPLQTDPLREEPALEDKIIDAPEIPELALELEDIDMDVDLDPTLSAAELNQPTFTTDEPEIAGQEFGEIVDDFGEIINGADASQLELAKEWTAAAGSSILSHLVQGSAAEKEKRAREEERRSWQRRMVAQTKLQSLDYLEQQLSDLGGMIDNFNKLLDTLEDLKDSYDNVTSQIRNNAAVISSLDGQLREAFRDEYRELGRLVSSIGGETSVEEARAAGCVLQDLGLEGMQDMQNAFTRHETMPGMVTYQNSEGQTVVIPQSRAELAIRMAPHAAEFHAATQRREAIMERYDAAVDRQGVLIGRARAIESEYESTREQAERQGERISTSMRDIDSSGLDLEGYEEELAQATAGFRADSDRLSRITGFNNGATDGASAAPGSHVIASEAEQEGMTILMEEGMQSGAAATAGSLDLVMGEPAQQGDLSDMTCSVGSGLGGMTINDLFAEYDLSDDLLAGDFCAPSYDFASYFGPSEDTGLFSSYGSFANQIDGGANSSLMSADFNAQSGLLIADNTVTAENNAGQPLFQTNNYSNMSFA